MIARIRDRFRHWERPAQVALGLALALLALAGLVVLLGPRDVRQPALIGLFGLVIVTQLIFMWANRGMVTPYTQAQRLYLAEDFEAACQLLEDLRAAGHADSRMLTLLGNAYRQRGMLPESEAVLLEALDIQPNHHYPLYGFGRTLLIQGRYAEAAQAIEQAFAAGAPPVVQFDAAEALYRSGQPDAALPLLEAALSEVDEPHRQLMGHYLLYRMDQRAAPDRALVEPALIYWQAQAERYADTPYGQALAGDVRAMKQLAEEV